VNRTLRIAAAVGALSIVVVATALAAPSNRGSVEMVPFGASHQASPGERANEADDGPPSAELLDKLVTRLGEAGVNANRGDIEALAADYGVGGAVRLLVWAQESGVSTGDLAAMFDAGTGWGEIARQLNGDNDALSLHPGLGSVMGGGNGNGKALGHANAPGQQKKTE
jgi:hypothetical protein